MSSFRLDQKELEGAVRYWLHHVRNITVTVGDVSFVDRKGRPLSALSAQATVGEAVVRAPGPHCLTPE